MSGLNYRSDIDQDLIRGGLRHLLLHMCIQIDPKFCARLPMNG